MEELNKIISSLQNVHCVFLSTVNNSGLPHITVARSIYVTLDNQVVVTSWFCPMTVVNVSENKQISVVIWDCLSDIGFQLLGEVRQMQEVGFLDGYIPKLESTPPLPQVERRLFIEVKEILEFRQMPHSDQKIEEYQHLPG